MNKNRSAKRLSLVICATAAALLAGCTSDGMYYGGSYSIGAGYGPNCDYYSPPWGYPRNYCDYSLWYDPVFYGGSWYWGPIYYLNYGGYNWYWLNGGWRRNEWHGRRPHIDWNDARNHHWQGGPHRGGPDGRGPGGRGRGPDGRNVGNLPPGNGTAVTPGGRPGGAFGGRNRARLPEPSQEGPRNRRDRTAIAPDQGNTSGGQSRFRNQPSDQSASSGGGQRSVALSPSPRTGSSGPRPQRSTFGNGGGFGVGGRGGGFSRGDRGGSGGEGNHRSRRSR